VASITSSARMAFCASASARSQKCDDFFALLDVGGKAQFFGLSKRNRNVPFWW
jgi:hypothetical protein